MSSVRLIPSEMITRIDRGGANTGTATIAWAIADHEGAVLPCGFGTVDAPLLAPKTLDYDEVILVLEGVFGVQVADGVRFAGKPGDVIELKRGCTVQYFGQEARIFFVTYQ